VLYSISYTLLLLLLLVINTYILASSYVLPNPMLFALAQKMPTEASGVISCCNPVPPLVRMNATELAYEIQNARNLAEQQQVERAAKVRTALMEVDTTRTTETQASSHIHYYTTGELIIWCIICIVSYYHQCHFSNQ
jgi:hypothetical protein